jgi:phosphorylated CTD-interacting factor 1
LDEGLVKDLSRVLPAIDARDVATQFTRAVSVAAEKVGASGGAGAGGRGGDFGTGSSVESAESAERSGGAAADEGGREGREGTSEDVLVQERGELLRLSLRGTPKPYVEISREHFDRLASLHATSAHSSGRGTLRSRALCLLLRYQTLGAHGMQCALPPAGFDLLNERLSVQFECFASPLNARYSRFCSAFPDLDAHFGSVGSFFDFWPTEGSFEANPPFVPEVMLAAIRHAEALLDAAERAGRALSFAFVVPTWEALPFHRHLLGSKWLRHGHHSLAADEHAFVDGAAHAKQHSAERSRPSSFGTTVGVIQTSVAANRWPVTSELFAALSETMAAALPSVGEADKRAARGGGDAVSLLLRRRARAETQSTTESRTSSKRPRKA